MALESAINIKAAAALAAVQLSVIWTDTVVTHTALDIRNPMHPLRQIEKLFLYNANTGVVSSNDAYIDAVVTGGEAPNIGNPFDLVADWLPITLTTATAETAEAANIVLTFSRDIANAANVTIGGDTVKSIVSVTIVAAVVTIVVSADYIAADTITVSGEFRTADSANILLAGQVVTNNIV